MPRPKSLLLRKSRVHRALRDFASIVAACVVALSARSSLADHYQVPTGSMEPTVHVGDHVVVDKTAYGLRVPGTHLRVGNSGPQRGDVVVLESPENGIVLLKRVVAIAGDSVVVRDGRLAINGLEAVVGRDGSGLVEALGGGAHAVALDFGGGPDFGPAVVPPEKVLVMGDNRGNSHDGRSFGFVDRASVLGRARGVFYREGALVWRSL